MNDNTDSNTFAREEYTRVKKAWGGVTRSQTQSQRGQKKGSTPFSPGRDFTSLSSVLNTTSRDMGWTQEMEQARLIGEWSHLVGETTAPHTKVVSLSNGVLLIQCDSTAWATQLRRMRAQILTQILDEYPQSGVDDIRFLSPDAPTWRHGKRVISGRGPRDTYS